RIAHACRRATSIMVPGTARVPPRAVVLTLFLHFRARPVTVPGTGHGSGGHGSSSKLHGAFRGFEHRRFDAELLELCVDEDAAAFLGVRPVEADDDWHRDVHSLECCQDPA